LACGKAASTTSLDLEFIWRRPRGSTPSPSQDKCMAIPTLSNRELGLPHQECPFPFGKEVIAEMV
jgi:hypothetical protein